MDAKKRGLLSGVYAGVGVVFAASAKFDWLSKGAAASFLSLVWLGFVLAISGTESWVKFRAPFMPRHLALDLGRTMFAALNSVEIGLCVGLWVLHYAVSSSGDAFWRLIIATLLLAVQAAWLYPKLQLTAEFALYEELKELDDDKLSFNQKMQFGEIRHQVQIQDRPHRIYHILYMGAEVVKILTLVSFALHFLDAIPA
ncbi:Membrane protein [Phytophthora palmivora]|uniref:Membrane protein n=1 Tax=Phytophthora palmivora TaxID=4796 RepID=A0A2P4YK04_9STRA|nr:Membrane protein [Phytophthora palmivora]